MLIKSSTISSSGDRSIPCLGSTVILITAGLRKKCEYDSDCAKVITSLVQPGPPVISGGERGPGNHTPMFFYFLYCI